MLLAFTAGFVDTCGFIALFGLFTAHVTGNFVLIGASIAEVRPGVIAKLLALPMFVVAVASTRWFVLRCEHTRRDAVAPLLNAQAMCLVLFATLGWLASPIAEPDAAMAVVVGLAGVAAMGVQNAASRTVFAALSPTTVMTGNVTQVVMDLVDLRIAHEGGPELRARLHKMWPPVVAFATGAVLGGLGYAGFGFACLLIPIAAVIAVLFLQRSGTR